MYPVPCIFRKCPYFFSANYLDNGVSRIVDQIVEQRMESIQSKVEEILYKYAGLEQPIKQEVKQENGTLEVDTNLLPTDLEQVSPDSDKKSITEVSMDEEVEEEIIDDDFESPAFEPVEPMIIDKSENSQQSDLSAISGLTSHDSEKSEQPAAAPETQQMQQDNELSQISSTPEETTTQDRPDSVSMTGLSGDEAQMATSLNETSENDPKSEIAATAEPDQPQKSQFDLKKDRIEFTGTERKSLQLDDSTASGDAEKVLQSNDLKVPKEVENLYANDTTDSSEMRMEIDLKDESTQETVASSAKVEDSSQGSTKDKHRSDKKDNKSDRSKDRHRSSSHNKSSSHRHHSSSSKSNRHDDKHRNYKDGKSSSNHKKSSNDKDRSRRDHDKKSPKDESSRSNKNRDKNEEKKTSDDHQQEKPSSRRRRSTDHDSNEAKSATKEKSTNSGENLTAVAPAPSEVSKETSNVDQPKSDEQKEVESKPLISDDENQDSCRGFTADELPHNPWFDILKRDIENNDKKKINNNYLDKKKMSLNFDIGSSSAAAKLKTKSKIKNLDSPGINNKFIFALNIN